MNKFLSSFTLLLGLVDFIYSDTADHLLLSTICTDPNNAEMIQIYNPTDDIIYLNDPNVGAYYLTDGNKPSSNKYYYNFYKKMIYQMVEILYILHMIFY